MDDNEGIDLCEVRKRYDRLDRIWATDDPWHLQVSRRYDKEIRDFLNENNKNTYRMLNIGSGDKIYSLSSFLINLDISEKFLRRHSNPICASATAIPLATGELDAVICIGSVINYCDAVAVTSEISRILRPGGRAFIEFESSEGFEYYGSERFGKIATIVDTRYGNAGERVWIYKPSYIKEIIFSSGMEISSGVSIHILSSFIYRIIKNDRISSVFCAFDRVLASTPLKKYAANVIFVCQKL